ncbi:thioredoxin domain-containing protein [Siphonobacter aquaeclarae]|uniref:Rhodanese-related sulfurtransferase n=1 Tax=Siphonobacter aquaeclarae TaxID=563176 RepID=A0A1G9HFN4_9BACT|nr:thioredoxin domain-containing protein [Siphonobacter aquaeclarae]SDL11861.1 Rhodanese-related sulfurtransferase [Siphonobacter aquaeclarae]
MKTLFALLAFAWVWPVAAQTREPLLSFDEFETRLKKAGADAQILDARSEEEYIQNHLIGAVSVATEADFQQKSARLSKEKPVFVYSIGNGRSGKLAKELKEKGFREVYELPGGLSKWIGSGRPVESTVGPGLSLAEYTASLGPDDLVLVDFGSRYCGSCKRLAPTVEEVKKEQAGRVKVITIEAYDNKSLTKEVGVNALPTLILYKNKQVVWQKSGVTPKAEIVAALAENSL